MHSKSTIVKLRGYEVNQQKNVYSRPPADLGTGEEMVVLENSGKGRPYITKKLHIRDLKISSAIGGKRSTEGCYWEGDDCIMPFYGIIG